MSKKIMHVRFDKESGEILSIGNKEYKNENSIPVEYERVEKIITGDELVDNYEVRYDTKRKKLEFTHKGSELSASRKGGINNFIFDVPAKKTPRSPVRNLKIAADITIVQDISNTCWKVYIGDLLRASLQNRGVNVKDEMMISVTAKGDPNILYKTLLVELNDLVTHGYVVLPFTMPFESRHIPLSIFLSRKFDTYEYKRIF